MVPHPYLLVAFGVALGFCAWAGYSHGVSTERDACLARSAQAAHAAAESARLHAEAEYARRADQARALDAQAAASREARLRGQLNALKSAPRPDCALPDDRLRDLNAAIAAANGQATAPIGMPHKLPSAAAPDGNR